MIGRGCWSFRALPERRRKAGEVVSEDKIMLHLKTLPFLFLLHTQLAKALPVPSEQLEEKNIKTAEVNELSITGDVLMVTEFGGWLALLSLEGQKEILCVALLRLSKTFWDLKDSQVGRAWPWKMQT